MQNRGSTTVTPNSNPIPCSTLFLVLVQLEPCNNIELGLDHRIYTELSYYLKYTLGIRFSNPGLGNSQRFGVGPQQGRMSQIPPSKGTIFSRAKNVCGLEISCHFWRSPGHTWRLETLSGMSTFACFSPVYDCCLLSMADMHVGSLPKTGNV